MVFISIASANWIQHLISERTSCLILSMTSWHLYPSTIDSVSTTSPLPSTDYQHMVMSYYAAHHINIDNENAVEFEDLKDIFRAVIKNASPIPHQPADGNILQFTTPARELPVQFPSRAPKATRSLSVLDSLKDTTRHLTMMKARHTCCSHRSLTHDHSLRSLIFLSPCTLLHFHRRSSTT